MSVCKFVCANWIISYSINHSCLFCPIYNQFNFIPHFTLVYSELCTIYIYNSPLLFMSLFFFFCINSNIINHWVCIFWLDVLFTIINYVSESILFLGKFHTFSSGMKLLWLNVMWRLASFFFVLNSMNQSFLACTKFTY